MKYRGSSHGTNEYPFLIDRRGIAVLPVTSLQLMHTATSERISTGLDWLDEMFGGKGYFRASSVLISGGAGTAKTTPGGLLPRRRLPPRRARRLFPVRGVAGAVPSATCDRSASTWTAG